MLQSLCTGGGQAGVAGFLSSLLCLELIFTPSPKIEANFEATLECLVDCNVLTQDTNMQSTTAGHTHTHIPFSNLSLLAICGQILAVCTDAPIYLCWKS